MALKAEDLQKLTEYTGLSDFETFDEAKEFFDGTFARKETYKKELFKDEEFINSVTGKRMRLVESKAKQFGKEFGIDIETDEIKNAKAAEDLMDLILTKARSKHNEEIDTLKKSVTEPNEAIKDWQTKADRYKSERDKAKKDYEDLGQQFEGYKTEVSTKEKTSKINAGLAEAYGKVKFKPEANEYEVVGFKTKMSEAYNFGLSEEGKFMVTDKNNNPIPNPKKAGTYYEADELFVEEAIKGKLYQLNPSGGNRPPNTQTRTTEVPSHGNEFERPINPRAMA